METMDDPIPCEGEPKACSPQMLKAPKCLDDEELGEGKCPKDCMNWFDGCNICTCIDGEIEMCTEMACTPEQMEKPRCTDEKPDDICPMDCVEWFDGCNTCSCENGKLGACTEMFCEVKEEPRCTDNEKDSCPADCSLWFDGCNTCSCVNGNLESCTELACGEYEEPKCMDDVTILRWSFDELSDFCKENKNNGDECKKACGKFKKGKCKGYKNARSNARRFRTRAIASSLAALWGRRSAAASPILPSKFAFTA